MVLVLLKYVAAGILWVPRWPSQAGLADGERRVFFVSPSSGDDKGPATAALPLASVQACVDRLVTPGDECRLQAGTYQGQGTVVVSGKHGTAENPIIIAAAGDGEVVFDGTAAIRSAWKVQGSIYSTSVDVPVWQLFGNGEMQVPARWPNAGWADKSVFQGPERWAHAGPIKNNRSQHNTTTGVGVLLDMGACADLDPPQPCCSVCNNNSLAKSGINATGAVAILNMWADGTGMEIIKKHQVGSNVLYYDATWCKAEIARRGKCGDGYRDGYGRYDIHSHATLQNCLNDFHFCFLFVSCHPQILP